MLSTAEWSFPQWVTLPCNWSQRLRVIQEHDNLKSSLDAAGNVSRTQTFILYITFREDQLNALLSSSEIHVRDQKYDKLWRLCGAGCERRVFTGIIMEAKHYILSTLFVPIEESRLLYLRFRPFFVPLHRLYVEHFEAAAAPFVSIMWRKFPPVRVYGTAQNGSESGSF